MNIKKVFILVDYRGIFYSSTKKIAGSVDVAKVKMLFEKQGYDVEIEKFSDVNFRSEKYNNSFVLYQSSEDPDLRYKDYIEDVLIGLELIGAVLIPDFYKFRAHHNKVFMEILRDVGGCNFIQNITSEKYGTLEELTEHINNIVLPTVVKQSAGSMSRGIGLCNSANEILSFAQRISRSFSLINFYRFIGGVLSEKGYKPISNFRKKFVARLIIDGRDETCSECVIIFTHGFALRVIAKALLNMSDEEFRYLSNPPNCYIATVNITKSGITLEEPLPKIKFKI